MGSPSAGDAFGVAALLVGAKVRVWLFLRVCL
jgi:hypothetical protein